MKKLSKAEAELKKSVAYKKKACTNIVQYLEKEREKDSKLWFS